SAGRPRRFVNRFRGRSGAGSAPAHGLAPQTLSPDKHVDVCADSGEDRGSTPLASILIGITALKRRQLTTELTTNPLIPSLFVVVHRRFLHTGSDCKMPFNRS